MRHIIVLALFGIMLSTTAQAGRLFPPSNIGNNPTVSCPQNRVLTWTGSSVDCADPTLGVVVTCPEGEYLTAIELGTPKCKPVSTTTLTAKCAKGYFLTGIENGAPICEAIAAYVSGGGSASASASASASTSVTSDGTTTTTSSSASASASATAGGYTVLKSDITTVSTGSSSSTCAVINSRTGGCSCPAGYAPRLTSSSDLGTVTRMIYTCYGK